MLKKKVLPQIVMQAPFPVDALKHWFLRYKRDLPWRRENTPYRVWISEIMLQQTQVSVVIPYFEKWMQTFPTIPDLAQSPLEKVIKTWEGLGYYSRARNIHRAADYFLKHHNGTIPSDPAVLATVPGFGPYTAGAVLSFAFQQKKAAVDANASRVISRYYGIHDPVDLPSVKNSIWEIAESILPNVEPWVIVEALIELGALICTKQPVCSLCPLESNCFAKKYADPSQLPVKGVRKQTTLLSRIVAVVTYQSLYLVKKGEKGKVMSDLYEFPYLESGKNHTLKEVQQAFEETFQCPLIFKYPLSPQKHSFTRFQATLYPYLFETQNLIESYEWKEKKEMETLPFSSGHKRILQEICHTPH